MKVQINPLKHPIPISLGIIVMAIVNLSLDWFTKWLAVTYLKGTGAHDFMWGIIKIVYAENTGAFLSMGDQWPPLVKNLILLYLPLLACGLGLLWALFKEPSIPKAFIIATIVGGGLGNLIDRIIHDFTVVDFLNFGIGSLRTGILNVADLSVTFGVLAFIVLEYKRPKKNPDT